MTVSRRALVIGGTLALLARPPGSGAQPEKMLRVGVLDAGSLEGRAPLWEAFRRGMRELGWVEGRNVTFEARGADGKPERLATLAGELVRVKVDVIVTAGTAATQAARQATATIPIVMATGGDPVGLRLVASLARPGGNVTGLTTQSVDLSAKRFELARALAPGASRFAMLGTGSANDALVAQETEAAARTAGVRLQVVTVRDPAELDDAFSTVAREQFAVLIVMPNPMLFGQRRRLADLALTHRLPTVHISREYAEAGGLVAYGVHLAELHHRAAVYADKILRGARPGDLPVEQPTRFELVVNLKTAKALGLTIPPSVLARADEIIK